jgi:opacity protein-like surface antigen
MNKNIKLAVAGAVLALSASAANAGIVIPAGDWTLDVSGNVNAYSVWSKSDNSATVSSSGITANKGVNSQYQGTNGLLPNFLGFTGTTRQNDLDVSFTISIQPGSSHNSALGVGADGGINNRQAFITFGDKS